ncbi:ENDD1 protein, partial [Scytalopus superciliaris]|nr:ENDD1 protein [Scytalopus superciliaris]
MLWLLLLQVWVSCLWMGDSELLPSFPSSFCPFFFWNTPPNNVLEPENPAWICQRYQNKYHYATLYDRDKRIPVYSAYMYQRGPNKRPKTPWMIEPQLVGLNYPKNMETKDTFMQTPKVTEQDIKDSQAVNEDYNNLKDLNRGHLAPSGHLSLPNSRIATFTLTNIVPQNSTLNEGAWNTYEQETMAQKTKFCKLTYVITGAVPGNTYIANGRVNVPSHIWSAACCRATSHMDAWGAIARNDEDRVEILNLRDLEARLAPLYKKGPVSLFHKNCPR